LTLSSTSNFENGLTKKSSNGPELEDEDEDKEFELKLEIVLKFKLEFDLILERVGGSGGEMGGSIEEVEEEKGVLCEDERE